MTRLMVDRLMRSYKTTRLMVMMKQKRVKMSIKRVINLMMKRILTEILKRILRCLGMRTMRMRL